MPAKKAAKKKSGKRKAVKRKASLRVPKGPKPAVESTAPVPAEANG